MNPSPTVLDNLKSGLIFWFYDKYFFLQKTVFGLFFVWILRHFSADKCFPFTILTNKVFPKEPSISFVILVAGLKIILPRPRHSEQVCSIVSGLPFSFPDKFAQGHTRWCWRDVRGPYFLHLQCLWNCRLWLPVFTILRSSRDSRYGFEISRTHRRLAFVVSLLVRLI